MWYKKWAQPGVYVHHPVHHLPVQGLYRLTIRDRAAVDCTTLFTERFFPALGLLRAQPMKQPNFALLTGRDVRKAGMSRAFAKARGNPRPALVQELLRFGREEYRKLPRSHNIDGVSVRPIVVATGSVLDPCALLTPHDDTAAHEDHYEAFRGCKPNMGWWHPTLREDTRGRIVLSALLDGIATEVRGVQFLGVQVGIR